MGTENGSISTAVAGSNGSAARFARVHLRGDAAPASGVNGTARQLRKRDPNWKPQPHQDWHWHDGTLSPNEFLRDVQREKRRAERSGSPLSLVSFRIDRNAAADPTQVDRLLERLHGSKRETDALGHVNNTTVAVLCPDTDEAGAESFTNKVAPLLEDLPLSTTTATYPDDLFDHLSKGIATDAGFRPFLVERNAAQLMHGGQYRLKRSLDILTALMALVVFWPLMIAVAVAVGLTSRGPIIFCQRRLGKDGVPFDFYKFRSMAVDVDDSIHREYVASLIKSGRPAVSAKDGEPAVYKLKSDPRVTAVGRVIRRTSIDELPQLFNVLKGDMSMVGPRPPIPYEAAHYEPWHLRRILTVRPGISGLWQVEGRSRVTFSEMVRMDLRYIRDCSLKLDLKILFKTITVVLRCDGAV